MSITEPRRKSEIDAQPLHRIARVPIRITSMRARWLLALTIMVDLAMVALYLASTLPDIRALMPAGRLASLDFAVAANLPWTWAVFKLYMLAAVCALMACSYSAGQRPDAFWRIGAIMALLMAIAESARLHEIWAASVAPTLFGAIDNPDSYMLISRSALLIVFFGAALSLFPARSKSAFIALSLSVIATIAAKIGPPAILLAS